MLVQLALAGVALSAAGALVVIRVRRATGSDAAPAVGSEDLRARRSGLEADIRRTVVDQNLHPVFVGADGIAAIAGAPGGQGFIAFHADWGQDGEADHPLVHAQHVDADGITDVRLREDIDAHDRVRAVDVVLFTRDAHHPAVRVRLLASSAPRNARAHMVALDAALRLEGYVRQAMRHAEREAMTEMPILAVERAARAGHVDGDTARRLKARLRAKRILTHRRVRGVSGDEIAFRQVRGSEPTHA